MRVYDVAVRVALEGVGMGSNEAVSALVAAEDRRASYQGSCPTSRQAILRVHISFSRLIYEHIRMYAMSLEYHSFNEIR
jgi:hypothetical protein